ncbi:hypothetical protein BTN49_0536 [Candidatus Enterovibrio escicola]|uniref:Uncharacterized protein n=1 Tax=Candidatus Enterovibrio escicola TaxID=1927127 RepID=A0A2A5T5Y0_9GAMM|nr:hypothetical protein BTN49_0536 [Candidatus Enterovibrio escacola]
MDIAFLTIFFKVFNGGLRYDICAFQMMEGKVSVLSYMTVR